jgi:hypothetical protein
MRLHVNPDSLHVGCEWDCVAPWTEQQDGHRSQSTRGGKQILAAVKALATSRKVAGSIPDEAVLGPGVYSASNRNEYQKHTNNNVSGE